MKKLYTFIESRNNQLPQELQVLQIELQSIFKKKILSAGVLQPGYFNDFYSVLEDYKNRKIISRYHISEEEHIDDNSFYKVPVIDIIRPNEQSNSRIFLIPF